MDVVQQEEGSESIIAQSSAVIWYKSYLFLKSKLKELLPAILVAGSHVLIKVKVEYHERYGMKLVIEDIDPSYTIGHMEMTRKKILQQLSDAMVIDLNGKLGLPKVISRVAVISSETAAGYKDFVAQLENNEYGYKYDLTLYAAAMQGQNTEREVSKALQEIAQKKDQYDCTVIIRGGGSKLDLSGFDNYNIGYNIATLPMPVLTGIGHEIDQSVADVTAHTALKTPTAVAAYLLDHNFGFESEVHQLGAFVGQYAKAEVQNYLIGLEQAWQYINMQPVALLSSQTSAIVNLETTLSQTIKHKIASIHDKLSYAEQLINLSDPATTLRRGYVMVTSDDGLVTSATDVSPGQNIRLTYHDGNRDAKIIN